MECSEPGIICDKELLAYLAGEKVRPLVVQHVACCHHCSAQVATYRRMEHILRKRLYRCDCPSPHALGEYHLGLLDLSAAEQITTHLEHCVHCTRELATGEVFLRQPSCPIGQAPEHVSLSHHRQAGNEQVPFSEVIQQRVRRIAALLLPQSPRFAMRKASQHISSWPRRYEAENVRVVLQLAQVPGQSMAFQLIGFVTCDDATLQSSQGVLVQLFSSSQLVYTQHIDDLGNFMFFPLYPSSYKMELCFPDKTVVIDQLEIQA